MAILEGNGISKNVFDEQLAKNRINAPLHCSPHAGSCTAVDVATELNNRNADVS